MVKKTMTYEEAYKKLEEILKNMEQGDLSLEDSMKCFEQANDLYKHCENLLTKAEGEIKIIMLDGEEVSEENFSVEV